MLVDMHIHEARFSPDSHIYLEDIVARAKSMGLDCIGITDHDSMGLKDYAERYSRKVSGRWPNLESEFYLFKILIRL